MKYALRGAAQGVKEGLCSAITGQWLRGADIPPQLRQSSPEAVAEQHGADGQDKGRQRKLQESRRAATVGGGDHGPMRSCARLSSPWPERHRCRPDTPAHPSASRSTRRAPPSSSHPGRELGTSQACRETWADGGHPANIRCIGSEREQDRGGHGEGERERAASPLRERAIGVDFVHPTWRAPGTRRPDQGATEPHSGRRSLCAAPARARQRRQLASACFQARTVLARETRSTMAYAIE